jgi:hypothetical protein
MLMTSAASRAAVGAELAWTAERVADVTTPSDHAVEFARQTIEATLGVSVETWDSGPRQGANDLRFELEGRGVAVEVKFDVDPRYREIERVASDTGYIRDDRLHQTWHANIAHDKRYGRALRALPGLLQAAEDSQWSGGQVWLLRRINAALAAQLESLGIRYLSGHPPTEKHPPGFYLMPDGWGGFVPGAEALCDYVSELLVGPTMRTLRRQLSDAEADERHAFLVVGIERMISVPLSSRDDPTLPTADPQLPSMVDGVWLCGSTADSRIVAWLPGQGWITAQRLASAEPEAACAG